MLDEEAWRAKEHDLYLWELNKRSEEPKKNFPWIETPIKESLKTHYAIAPKRINMTKYEDLMKQFSEINNPKPFGSKDSISTVGEEN